jgi:hypothetical protein
MLSHATIHYSVINLLIIEDGLVSSISHILIVTRYIHVDCFLRELVSCECIKVMQIMVIKMRLKA